MKDVLEILEESVIVVNSKSQICYCNPTFAGLVKMDREEIEGKEISYFLIAEKIKENCKEWENIVINIKNNFIRGQVKKFIKQYNGQELEIYIIREIEDKIRIQLYEELLDQIGLPVWIRDPGGELYYCNKDLDRMIEKDAMLAPNSDHESQESDYRHNIMIPIHQDKAQMATYNIIQEQNEDRRIYIEQLVAFRGKNINQFCMGVKHDITGLCEAGIQISDCEKDYLDGLGVKVSSARIAKVWKQSKEMEEIQKVQEQIRKVMKTKNFMLCLFTKQKDMCLMSIVDEEKHPIRGAVSIPTPIQESLLKMDRIECSCEEIQEFKANVAVLTKSYREESIENYEVYPIKFLANVIGAALIKVEHKSDRYLFRTIEVMFMSHQLAIYIKYKLLKQNIYKIIQRQKEAKTNLKYLLQVLADVVVCIDKEGSISDIKKIKDNSELAIIAEHQKYIGTCFINYIYPDDRNKVATAEELQSEKKATYSLRILSKGDEYVWYKWIVNYEEDRQRYICIGKDITYEKMVEIKKKAHKQAKEIEKIRNEFFANISHEFRTPINIILSSIKLLDSKKDQDDLSWYTQKIEHNALRLLKLSNNLIDLTRMGLANDNIQMKNQSIVSLIQEITMSADVYAQKKEIQIEFNTSEEEIIMACNAEKIKRMLLNLLSNAVKFTPRGGEINVSIRKKHAFVEIRVKDTGIGIPKEKCDIIFERFVQVDTSLRRISEGSGMGLAIAKRMAEIHNGTISAESEEGKGTTFIIKLPIVINTEETVGSRKEVFKDTMDQTKIEFSDVYYD